MAVTIKRALISVFDKTGLDVLAESLKSLGVTVLSTGGTAKKLRELGVEVIDVKDVTKYPEMLGEFMLDTPPLWLDLFANATGLRLQLLFLPHVLPTLLGGRVKTLHPVIHGGLLANRQEPGHMAELKEHGIEAIDLVVSNLYPFEDVSLRFAPSALPS